MQDKGKAFLHIPRALFAQCPNHGVEVSILGGEESAGDANERGLTKGIEVGPERHMVTLYAIIQQWRVPTPTDP